MTELEFPKSRDPGHSEDVSRTSWSQLTGLSAEGGGLSDGDRIHHERVFVSVSGEKREPGTERTQRVDFGSRGSGERMAGLPTVDDCAALKAEVRCLREIVSGLENERDFLRHLLERELPKRRNQDHDLAPVTRPAADDGAGSAIPADGGYHDRDTPSVDFMDSANAGFPQDLLMRRGRGILPLAAAVLLIILLSFLLLDKLLLLNSVLAEG